MRKQDRIASEKSRGQEQSDTQVRPEPRESEQMKGSASTTQSPRPQQRQGGKLPLPD